MHRLEKQLHMAVRVTNIKNLLVFFFAYFYSHSVTYARVKSSPMSRYNKESGLADLILNGGLSEAVNQSQTDNRETWEWLHLCESPQTPACGSHPQS